jgi:hypothetical protein
VKFEEMARDSTLFLPIETMAIQSTTMAEVQDVLSRMGGAAVEAQRALPIHAQKFEGMARDSTQTLSTEMMEIMSTTTDAATPEQLKSDSSDREVLQPLLTLALKFEEMERDSTRLRLIATMAATPAEMVEVQDELWKLDMNALGDLLQFQTLVAQCEETVKELVQKAATMETLLLGMDVVAPEL